MSPILDKRTLLEVVSIMEQHVMALKSMQPQVGEDPYIKGFTDGQKMTVEIIKDLLRGPYANLED